MNYELTEDLVEYVEDELREISDGSSDFRDRVINLVNHAHKSIVSGGQELNDQGQRPIVFHWARSKFPKTLTLLPKLTNTATITQDGTALTLGTSESTDLTGNYFIRIGNDNEVYRITAHVGGTGVTIDSPYIAADVTSAECEIFKLIYDITGILVPASPIKTFRRDGANEIRITAKATLDKRYPITDIVEADPTMAGILKLDADTETLSIQLNSIPLRRERAQLECVPVPDTLVIGSVHPILPKQHRLVIGELAAHYLCVGLDDDRATVHLARARALFDALVRENQTFEESGNSRYGELHLTQDDYHINSFIGLYEDGSLE
jgi:hypothetical protein